MPRSRTNKPRKKTQKAKAKRQRRKTIGARSAVTGRFVEPGKLKTEPPAGEDGAVDQG